MRVELGLDVGLASGLGVDLRHGLELELCQIWRKRLTALGVGGGATGEGSDWCWC